MPVVDSIDELNDLFESADDADDARRIGNRANSVGHDWAPYPARTPNWGVVRRYRGRTEVVRYPYLSCR